MDPVAASSKQQLKWVNTRIPIEDYQRAQELADRLYDGNLSMLLRAALREFVADRAPTEVVS